MVLNIKRSRHFLFQAWRPPTFKADANLAPGRDVFEDSPNNTISLSKIGLRSWVVLFEQLFLPPSFQLWASRGTADQLLELEPTRVRWKGLVLCRLFFVLGMPISLSRTRRSLSAARACCVKRAHDVWSEIDKGFLCGRSGVDGARERIDVVSFLARFYYRRKMDVTVFFLCFVFLSSILSLSTV